MLGRHTSLLYAKRKILSKTGDLALALAVGLFSPKLDSCSSEWFDSPVG